MWPFIIILATVPLLYYWSDAVVTVFPVLAQYLPENSAKVPSVLGAAPGEPGAVQAQPNKWTETLSETGYVIWLVSADGQYRVAAGCRKATPALMQVTHISGKAVPDQLMLSYQGGEVLLTSGAYAGSGLVNAVAQFGQVTMHLPQAADQEPALAPPAVIAKFSVDRRESNMVARGLQQNCSVKSE